MIIASIDDAPAPESALASTLAKHGFASRQGSLVRLAGESNRRLGSRHHERPLLHEDFDEEEALAELGEDEDADEDEDEPDEKSGAPDDFVK
jgi:hypothetical protein